MKVSKSSDDLSTVTAGEIAVVFLLGVSYHVVLLVFNYCFTSLFSMDLYVAAPAGWCLPPIQVDAHGPHGSHLCTALTARPSSSCRHRKRWALPRQCLTSCQPALVARA